MAWEAKLWWAGEFTGHSVQHDLEALVWCMWVFCVNMDGPFNKKRFKCGDFEKPPHLLPPSKRIKLEDHSADSTSKSQGNKGDAGGGHTTPQMTSVSSSSNAQAQPPSWSRPGLHAESIRAVARQKCSYMAERLEFTACLSPYFAKHHSVIQGFRALQALFVWRDIKDINQNVVRQPPTPTTYKAVMDILREIRDGIDGTMDGPPSKEEFERARAEFAALLKKGDLETPLLGKEGKEGPLRSQPQTKKRPLNDDDDDDDDDDD